MDWEATKPHPSFFDLDLIYYRAILAEMASILSRTRPEPWLFAEYPWGQETYKNDRTIMDFAISSGLILMT